MRSKATILFALGVSGLLSSCRTGSPQGGSPLPAAWAQQRLSDPDTLNLADYLGHWHPRDWRVALAQAVAGEDSAYRRDYLATALALRPGEPMLQYFLGLEYLGLHTGSGDSLALWFLDQAATRQPGNGILDLTRAVAQSRLGRYTEARAVFRAVRGFPDADLFGMRLERSLLGALDLGLRLNPYDLIQAQEWYRGMPLPPIEEWSAALETIFLDPLKEHPYDIRWRGREAALGLYRLGGKIVAGSLNPDRVFSDGREERLLGWLLQAKAGEFLRAYARTFDSSSAIPERETFALDAQLQNAVSTVSLLPVEWDGYLRAWEEFEQVPGFTVEQACRYALAKPLWRKVRRATLFSD